jgi:hypothetical protein
MILAGIWMVLAIAIGRMHRELDQGKEKLTA